MTDVPDAEIWIKSLQGADYEQQSPKDRSYNCFGWAARRVSWMEPPGLAEWTWWPEDVPTWISVPNYMRAYETLGFEQCDDGRVEQGFEKIALFIDEEGDPSHAARQLPSGKWTSKLGRNIDIEHELADLDGDPQVGNVAVYMKRKCPGAPPPPPGVIVAKTLDEATE